MKYPIISPYEQIPHVSMKPTTPADNVILILLRDIKDFFVEIWDSIWSLETDQIAIISLVVTLLLFVLGKRSENKIKIYETRKEEYQKLINFFIDIFVNAGNDIEKLTKDNTMKKNRKKGYVISMKSEINFLNTPIVDVVNYILVTAAKKNASDIHFDPAENHVKVRFRIDGKLDTFTIVPNTAKQNLIARLKIMAGMNITETRLPQDGAIRTVIEDVSLDMRVSSLPTKHGEKIVIRILDYSKNTQGIEYLYFNEVNTIPGSLAFYLYQAYSFKEFIDLLIKDALFRYHKECDMIKSFDTNILSVKVLKMKK